MPGKDRQAQDEPLFSPGDAVLWCLATAMALALQVFPGRSPFYIAVCVVAMWMLLVYPVCHLPWVRKAFGRRIIALIIISCAIVAYGKYCWPPVHRHTLSKAEREKFEEPLKGLKQPQKSIHLYCAPEDEVDCEYAADLIPFFGEAGWDVASMVERVTLGRPKSGILVGLHGTVKPEDEPKLKWNEGEWTLITPEEGAVRQAFVNIGIEPDSISGATIPENQINIYVGRERENESAPTDMTRTFENLERDRREHPERYKH